jgi:hypothetical protein
MSNKLFYEIIHNIEKSNDNIFNYYRLSSKFGALKHIINNIFLDTKCKDEIVFCFFKAQKIYGIFNRIAKRYRKMSKEISYDLNFNPICESDKNVFIALQSGKKYLFTVSHFIKIVHSSLIQCQHFIPFSKICKNPYTNIQFSSFVLYNFYFFLKERGYIVPFLFELFFRLNFNILEFRKKYSTLIIDQYISNLVKNVFVDDLYSYTNNMIKYYNKINVVKLEICKNFSKQKLVDTMRPFLKTYLKFIHASNEINSLHNESKWKKDLTTFIKQNPGFGRRILVIKSLQPVSPDP